MAAPTRTLLHSHHEKNFIEVVDEDDYRSLYFKDNVIQSRISLQSPHQLLLRYTQFLMGATLLVNPKPKKILLIGVGAGAVLHFINHYLPQAEVVGVDYSNHVIDIAREFFFLPENKNISVLRDDGLHYLTTRTQQEKFDLILIDAFNDHGMAKNIYSNEFFRYAREHTAEDGLICVNIWVGNKAKYNVVRKSILKHADSALFIPVCQRENEIALLFQKPIPWEIVCPGEKKLQELSMLFGFDFRQISDSARKNNMKLAERVRLWLEK